MKKHTTALNRRDLIKLSGASLLFPKIAYSHSELFPQALSANPIANASLGHKSVLLICELGTEDITISNLLAHSLPKHTFLRDFFYTGKREQSAKYNYVLKDGIIQLIEAQVQPNPKKTEVQRRLGLLQESAGIPYLFSAYPHEITSDVVSFLKKNQVEIIWVKTSDRHQQEQTLKNYFLSHQFNDWASPVMITDKGVTLQQWDQANIDWDYVRQSQYLFKNLQAQFPGYKTVYSHMGPSDQRLASYAQQLDLAPMAWDYSELWGNVRFFKS